MRFWPKLNILLLSITIFTSLAIFSFCYFSSVNILEKQVRERTQDTTAIVMDKIDRLLFERYQDVLTLADDPVIRDRNSTPSQINQRLIEYRNRAKTVVSLSFFDLNRIRVADTNGLNLGKQHDLVGYWHDVLEGRVCAAWDVRFAEEMHMPIVYFASPVKDKSNQIFGVVVLRMSIYRLHDILKEIFRAYHQENVHIELVDKNGLLLYSTYEPGKILKEKTHTYEFLVKAIKEGKSSYKHFHDHIQGGEFFDFFAIEKGYLDFKGNQWALVVHVPINIILAPAQELSKQLIAVLVPILLIVIFIAFVFSRKLANPLKKLNEAALHFSQGELDYKIKIDSKDEVGAVGDSFAKMALDLQASYEGLEEKIRQVVKEWERTFNSITDLIFIQDTEFNIIRVNNAFANAIKKKPQEIIGKKCYEVLHALDKPWSDCPFEKTLVDSLMHIEEVDDPHIGIPLLVSTSPLFDDSGKLIGSVHVARDISKQKQAEREIREASEAKSRFTSMVSHELRTPLTAIREGIALVIDGLVGPLNDRQKEFLDVAMKHTDRLKRLIDDILDFQKLGVGKLKLDIRDNDLVQIVEEVVKVMMPLAGQRKLDLKTEIEKDLPQVKFDRDRITQVLYNLLSNAIKVTEKGSIVIKIIRQEDFIQVGVQDTGCGIKEEDRPKLFQDFEQVGSDKYRRTGSSGLGLAISKGIVEAHGGKIWFDSVFGKGSTFYFTLPLKGGF